MNTNITFLINKSEITAGTRGASLGPDAIITAARKNGSSIFSDNNIDEIKNWNDLLNKPVKYPYAKRIIGLLNVYEELNSKISSLLNSNVFPLVLAADHGSAGGTISGIKSAFPNKRIGVVWIDAHADIHTPYTTPSGNLHGMPLASVLDIDNLECKINDIDADTEKYWNKLKNVGGFSKKINTEDLVYVGVRDTEAGEEAVMKQFGIKSIEVDEVRKRGVSETMKLINDQLKDCDLIYVSFDVDSMDPNLTSHGTGTPVPNGITPDEAKELMVELAANPKTACIEVVEVNPCLDEKKNTMAEVALDIIEAVTEVLKNR